MLQTVKGKKIGTFLLFLLVFAISRIPGTGIFSLHLPNFSAAYALMFCAGVYLTGSAAWWMPLCAMVITDFGLNCYYWLHGGYNVWTLDLLREQSFNYLAYVAMIWLGRRFKPKSSFFSLLGGGLLGALIFYLVTNTASWLFNPFHNPEYTKNLIGWLTALFTGTRGWPETWEYFRNTFLSGGLFTAFFVGVAKLAASESPQDKTAGASDDESESDAEENPEEAPA